MASPRGRGRGHRRPHRLPGRLKRGWSRRGEGATLAASASEVTRSSRLATCRIDVAREDGKIVAVFTGTVFITGDAHQAPDPARA